MDAKTFNDTIQLLVITMKNFNGFVQHGMLGNSIEVFGQYTVIKNLLQKFNILFVANTTPANGRFVFTELIFPRFYKETYEIFDTLGFVDCDDCSDIKYEFAPVKPVNTEGKAVVMGYGKVYGVRNLLIDHPDLLEEGMSSSPVGFVTVGEGEEEISC